MGKFIDKFQKKEPDLRELLDAYSKKNNNYGDFNMTLDEIKNMSKEEFLNYINSLYNDKNIFDDKLIDKIEYKKLRKISKRAQLDILPFFIFANCIGITTLYIPFDSKTLDNICKGIFVFLDISLIIGWITEIIGYNKRFNIDKFNELIYNLHDELCKLDENKLKIIKGKINFDVLKNMNNENINKSDVLKTAKIMQDAGLEDLLLRFEARNGITSETKYKDGKIINKSNEGKQKKFIKTS